MATRNRNRNRTQRRNKNRSRRNRQGGGAPPISCNNARGILNDPQAGMVKKMAAKVQLKSCANGMKTVAPTKKWFNSTTKNSEYGYCDSGYSSKGSTTCKDGTSPVKPPGLTV